ncbi:diacylglycerol/lipid kinase family protein [Hutsoniella sourekii]
MTNRVHIICHPQAGNGQGLKVLQEAIKILDSFQMQFLVYQTDYASHAELLTRQVVLAPHQDYQDYLLVIGGDGTLHEVVEALQTLQLDIPITYLPAGKGNDFAYNYLQGYTLREIIEAMIFQREAQYVPIFHYQEHHQNTQGIILNNLGFGFDAIVNQSTQDLINRLPDFLGNYLIRKKYAYKLSTLLNLTKIPYFHVSLAVDGAPSLQLQDISLIGIMNQPSVGGGMVLHDQVYARNEEIAVVVYQGIDKQAVRDILPRVTKNQNQHQSPHIHLFKGQSIDLQVKSPILGQMDGEVINPLDYDYHVWLGSQAFYLPSN